MTINNARSISPKELEARRRQAVMLFENGYKIFEISPIVGAHRNAVGRWIKTWKEEGERGLRVNTPGRPRGTGCRLTGWQASAIKRSIVDKSPDQLKFPFALWTREAVQLLIRDQFAIEMPIRTVGEYLKRWGFTAQKPKKRAYERNEKAVQQWLTCEYPAIKERAGKEGAEIQWGDETGVRSDDVVGRSYSPKGQTPVVKRKGCRERLSMFSTITNRGKLRFSIYEGAMNSALLVKLLKRLVRDCDKKVFLILDNLSTHHSKPVKKWLEENRNSIEVFFLPRYTQEINPDEYLNNEFKREVRKRPDSRQKGSLQNHCRSVMHSLQKQPNRIISCFHTEDTRYAL